VIQISGVSNGTPSETARVHIFYPRLDVKDMPRTSRRLAEVKRVELGCIFRMHHKVVYSQHFKHLEECNCAHFHLYFVTIVVK